MKKAILLFSMVIFVAGVLYLKDADADTVLIKSSSRDNAMERLVQDTEEVQDAEPEEETEMIMAAETESISGNDIAVVTSADTVSSFAFLSLSLEEQQIYTEILASLLKYEEETDLSTRDASRIDKAFQCVMLDHPEIFYVDGYKYTEYTSGDTLEKITFSGNYLYDIEEIQDRQKQIKEVVAKLLDEAPDTDDEYEKVKYAYETIINNTEYDLTATDHQNICSVFLNGRSVCQGYAKGMQYLLLNMGIESALVIGTVRGGDGHAWNLASINNEWYYLDATWGDAYYLFGADMQEMPVAKGSFVNYDYLCVTTEQIEKTHAIDMPIELPVCIAFKDNYYVREGLYFEEYDEERIVALFGQAVAAGKETVTIKCDNGVVYEAVCRELIEEQKVFELVQTDDGTIAYTDNPEERSITFWL